MRIGVLVAAAVLVGAGCSGGATDEPAATTPTPGVTTTANLPPTAASKVTSIMATAAAIAKAGLGCGDFTRTASSPDQPNPKPTQSGRCTVGATVLKIDGYGSSADAESAFIAGQALACAFGRDQANGRTVVMAGSQILGLDDSNAAALARIAAAVAGKTRSLRC